jgi:hypothetical protein
VLTTAWAHYAISCGSWQSSMGYDYYLLAATTIFQVHEGMSNHRVHNQRLCLWKCIYNLPGLHELHVLMEQFWHFLTHIGWIKVRYFDHHVGFELTIYISIGSILFWLLVYYCTTVIKKPKAFWNFYATWCSWSKVQPLLLSHWKGL